MSTATHSGPTPTTKPPPRFGRNWRRLRRRPWAMQLRTVFMILAVIVGLVVWLLMAPSGTAGASEVAASAAKFTPVGQASTSTRGVSAKSINVVFPVISLSSIAGEVGPGLRTSSSASRPTPSISS